MITFSRPATSLAAGLPFPDCAVSSGFLPRRALSLDRSKSPNKFD
jgi:hypothetical protein